MKKAEEGDVKERPWEYHDDEKALKKMRATDEVERNGVDEEYAVLRIKKSSEDEH